MSGARARRLLHGVHVVTTVGLVATGVLIAWPDLRARLVGGYGRELGEIHVWLGWAFLAAPGLALAAAARPLLADLRGRFAAQDPWRWRRAHVALTLGGGGVLGVTGVAAWAIEHLPVSLVDASLVLHSWVTWLVVAALPVHLVMARRKIAGRVREWLGAEPPPLFDFADDDGPDEV